jgi:hypothetical protein
MRTLALACAALLTAASAPVQAQEKTATISVYKVEFRIRDGSDAASKTGRRYTMLCDTTGHGIFKVGDRIPVSTAPNQMNYLDIGVNIDTTVREHANEPRVALFANMDFSTLVEHKPVAGFSNPTVAQMRVTVDTLITPGKPTLVASIDDPVTQHKVDIEAVVTKE